MIYNRLMSGARFAGFVLVGGKSRRMGRHKALLPLPLPATGQGGERPLAAVLAGRVARAAGSATLVGDSATCQGLGWPVLEDLVPGCGPLSGIHAALHSAAAGGARWNLIVACDLPFLTVAFLRYLLELAAAEDQRPETEAAQLIVPRSARGYELAVVIRQDAAREVEDAMARSNWKLSRLYHRLRCRSVTPAEYAPFDPDGFLFHNVNTPEDLERALKQSRESPRRRAGGGAAK